MADREPTWLAAVDCVLRAKAPLVLAINHVPALADAFLDASASFSLEDAVENGSERLFERVLHRLQLTLSGPERERLTSEIDLGIGIKHAVNIRRLDLVQRIHDVHPRPLCSRLLRAAAAAGDLAILEWLLKHRTDGLCVKEPASSVLLVSGSLTCCHRFVYYEALNASQHHVVRWLFDRGYIDILEGAGDAAAAAGDLDMVRWVDQQQVSQSFSSDALDNAACRGHLDIVHYLIENRSEGCTAVGINGAINGNHDEITAVLRATQPALSDNMSVVAVHAAAAGRLDLLSTSERDQTERWHFEIAMYVAAEHGHVHILEWLVNEKHLVVPPAARASAAGNGHLPFLQWVHNHTQDAWSVDVMNRAAQNGQLDIVKWLHENRDDGCTASAMNGAAENGHLEVVKWLHDNRSEGCSVEAMNGAAIQGHLDVVKWLHENRHEGCTIEAMNEAAANGHLEVIKWLHVHVPDGCTERAMDRAAHGGHLAVLQFLREHRTEGCTSQASVGAANFGHEHLVKWLLRHYPIVYDAQLVADGMNRWSQLRASQRKR